MTKVPIFDCWSFYNESSSETEGRNKMFKIKYKIFKLYILIKKGFDYPFYK